MKGPARSCVGDQAAWGGSRPQNLRVRALRLQLNVTQSVFSSFSGEECPKGCGGEINHSYADNSWLLVSLPPKGSVLDPVQRAGLGRKDENSSFQAVSVVCVVPILRDFQWGRGQGDVCNH